MNHNYFSHVVLLIWNTILHPGDENVSMNSIIICSDNGLSFQLLFYIWEIYSVKYKSKQNDFIHENIFVDAVYKASICHSTQFIVDHFFIIHTSYLINTLRPKQDGRHFPDDIFKCIFLNENEFRLRFHWSLFPRAKLTKIHHWFR